MKLIVDIPDTEYQMFIVACNHGIGNTAMERILDGKPFDDVLNKIRAEIERERSMTFDEMREYRQGIDDALAIIGKYRAESEEV